MGFTYIHEYYKEKLQALNIESDCGNNYYKNACIWAPLENDTANEHINNDEIFLK